VQFADALPGAGMFRESSCEPPLALRRWACNSLMRFHTRSEFDRRLSIPVFAGFEAFVRTVPRHVAYALLVVISEELRRLARESEQWLALTAPETSRGAAALLREVMPRLSSGRQRQLAEEMAHRFESRADAYAPPSSV